MSQLVSFDFLLTDKFSFSAVCYNKFRAFLKFRCWKLKADSKFIFMFDLQVRMGKASKYFLDTSSQKRYELFNSIRLIFVEHLKIPPSQIIMYIHIGFILLEFRCTLELMWSKTEKEWGQEKNPNPNLNPSLSRQKNLLDFQQQQHPKN
jgi:hypothetical protein